MNQDIGGPSSVKFIGPFGPRCDVVVGGRRMPHMHAFLLDGGKVHLVCDRAVGITLPVGLAEEVTAFVAFAMQIAERGAYWSPVHELTGIGDVQIVDEDEPS